MTIRQQEIMDALGARLQTIQVRNGYLTDIGNNVVEWKTQLTEDDDLPVLTYRDTLEDTKIPTRLHQHELTVEIEVITASGSTTPMMIRMMKTDILAAIGKDPFFGKKAIKTVPTQYTTTIEQNDKIIGGAKMLFIITYATAEWQT